MKKLANQLATAKNPYLRAHKKNPVAWQKWDPATLELARRERKPIFLSSGFHSCHWCKVMNTNYFSQEKVAQVLNTQFVPIKIDREERPDIDTIYMLWLQTKFGQGGWPLNVFLEPEGLKAFFGGTYWSEETAGISFLDVLQAVSRDWKGRQQECLDAANVTAEALAAAINGKSEGPVVSLNSLELASEAGETMMSRYDVENGGFMGSPKFVMAPQLETLRSYADLFGGQRIADAATSTLEAVYRGGIHDPLGGGLHRYSVSGDWHLPHFEKMLLDQATTLKACLPEPIVLPLAHDLVKFMVDGPLSVADGSGLWYSAVDADTEGVSGQGNYYTWTWEEFQSVLKSLPLLDRDMVDMHFGIQAHGNVNPDLDVEGDFKNRNILSVKNSAKQISEAFGRPVTEVQAVLDQALELLRAAQKQRKAPEIDTKIVTAWNGAAISALVRASSALSEPALLDRAILAASSLQKEFGTEGNLLRTVGGDDAPAVCDDYTSVIEALIDLYDATQTPKWLQWAQALQQRQNELFADPRGGYFQSQDHTLWVRLKSAFDGAEPNYNSTALSNLERLGHHDASKKLVDCYSDDINAQPAAYLTMLPNVSRT